MSNRKKEGRGELNLKCNNKYSDMLYLPHHVSAHHPQMPIQDRAAQFAPFAALTGHKDAISETARVTDAKAELDENRKAILDGKLQILQEQMDRHPVVTITYFEPDRQKAGGVYRDVTDSVKKIDEYQHKVVLLGGESISIENIAEIDGELFYSSMDHYI